jgi:hypothetical protein
MKLQPLTPSFVSVTLLGILVAACSSKSTDDGVGTDIGSQGGANASQGGAGNGTSTGDTGGSNNAALGGSTTGNTSAARTGGASSLVNLPKACPGLPIAINAVDAGTATDVDAGEQCAGVGIELEPSPLDIFMMMDRSMSMTYLIQNTGIHRWDVLQSGVQKFLNDSSVQAKAPRVGLAFFGVTGNPNDPSECDSSAYAKPIIEIGPLDTTGPQILQAVTDEGQLLGGQTPTFPALQGALMHAQDWQVANPQRLTVVVYITDGYPTECNIDTSQIQEMVGEYYAGINGQYNTRGEPGIRTYVIGVAVDKFNVDNIAQSGGTGSATIVDSAGAVDQFVSAMVNITNANISCSIAVPNPPAGKILDPDQVQVVYKPFQGDNQEIPKADSASGCGATSGGWYFDDPAHPKNITLCPCSCANLGAGGIEIRLGCRARIPIG